MVERAAQVDPEEFTGLWMVMAVSNWSDIYQKGWSNALHLGFFHAG